MKRMGDYQWPLTLDASPNGERTGEKWPSIRVISEADESSTNKVQEWNHHESQQLIIRST